MAARRWLTSAIILIITSCLIQGTEAAFGFGDVDYERNFIEYYSAHKLLSKCYGNGTVDDWQCYIDKVFDECVLRPEVREGDDVTQQLRASATLRGMMKHPFYDAKRVENLIIELSSHVTEMSCIFKALNWEVCSSGFVRGGPLLNYINSRPMKDNVRTELEHEIKQCELQSLCGDHRLLGRSFVKFFKLVKFYKCWQDARLRACVRHDVNVYSYDFQIDGLKTFATDLNDISKRVFIASAYYNDDNKYGGLLDYY